MKILADFIWRVAMLILAVPFLLVAMVCLWLAAVAVAALVLIISLIIGVCVFVSFVGAFAVWGKHFVPKFKDWLEDRKINASFEATKVSRQNDDVL